MKKFIKINLIVYLIILLFQAISIEKPVEKEDKFFSLASTPDLIISNEAELRQFSANVGNGISYEGQLVVLQTTINCTNTNPFPSIGSYTKSFKGTFDGNGFAITGLNINSQNAFRGLFGSTENAVIKNLGIKNSTIFGGSYTGSLVGIAQGTLTIENCYNLTRITSTSSAGGLVGSSSGTLNIINSFNAGQVSGSMDIGGLVGEANIVNITNSFNTGVIGSKSGGAENIGGLVGSAAKATITKSYSVCEVNGEKLVGGLIGKVTTSASIDECYVGGKISGTTDTFGFSNSKTTITNSYFNQEINPLVNAYSEEVNEEFTSEGFLMTNNELEDVFSDDWTFKTNQNMNYYYPQLKVFSESSNSDHIMYSEYGVKIIIKNVATGSIIPSQSFDYLETYEVLYNVSVTEFTNITYTYASISSNDYTTVKPVNAGNYKVRITFLETLNYKTLVLDGTFEINKIQGIGSVSIDDFDYNQTPSTPVLSSDTNNSATFEYSGINGTNYPKSDIMPTQAGQYELIATFEDSLNYLGFIAYDTFTINKIEGSALVSMDDYDYNQTPSNYVITNSNYNEFDIIVEYEGANYPRSTESPLNAGAYQLIITFLENDNYLSIEVYTTFNINKINGVASVSVDDFDYNTTTSPIPNSATNTQVSYFYESIDDYGYSSNTMPYEVGRYKVIATFAENENYLSVVCEDTFEIFIIDPTFTQTQNYVYTYPQTLNELTINEVSNTPGEFSFLSGSIVFETDVTQALILFTPDDTRNFNSKQFVLNITIQKGTQSSFVECAGTVYLTALAPNVKDVKEDAIYSYMYYNLERELVPGLPTEAGIYEIVAVLEETKNYNAYITPIKMVAIDRKKIAKPVAKDNLVYNGLEQIGITEVDESYYYEGVTLDEFYATEAGDYVAYVKLNNNYQFDDYSTDSYFINWSIQPKVITEFEITTESWTYLDVVTDLEYINLPDDYGDVINIDYSYTSYSGGLGIGLPVNASFYTITLTITGNKNYIVTATKDITINPIIVDKPAILDSAYNNTLYKPTIVNQPYYLNVENNGGIKAGSYFVKITLKDNYAWSSEGVGSVQYQVLTINYNINKATETTGEIIFPDFVYSKYEITPTVTSETFPVYDGTINYYIYLDGVYVNINNCNLNSFNVGSYLIKIEFKETDNCNSFDFVSTFNILHYKVSKPQAIDGLIYDNTSQHGVTLLEHLGVYYNITSGSTEAVKYNEDGYSVTFRLTHNYAWEDSRDDLTVTFYINKRSTTATMAISSYEWDKFVFDAIFDTEPLLKNQVDFSYSYYYFYNAEWHLLNSTTYPKIPGDYPTKVVCKSSNYEDVEGLYNFTVYRSRVSTSIVYSLVTPIVYNGLTQKIFELNGTELFSYKDDYSAIEVGTYTATIYILDTVYYEFEEDSTYFHSFVIDWDITQKNEEAYLTYNDFRYKDIIVEPTIHTQIFDYTYVFYYLVNEAWVMDCPTLPGTYKVYAVLTSHNFTETTTDVIEFNILRALITKPTVLNEDEYNTSLIKANVTESEFYVISNNYQTDADTYYVTVSLIDTYLYEWEDFTDEDLSLEWIINKTQFSESLLTLSASDVVYDGVNTTSPVLTQLISYGLYNTVIFEYSSDNISFSESFDFNANTYYVRAVLIDALNYFDYTTNAVSFKILKQEISKPTLTEGLVYDGSILSPIKEQSSLYTFSLDTEKINAGLYNIRITLTDFNNYYFTGEENEYYETQWEISKARYVDITHEEISVVYTKTNTLNDIELESDFYFVNPSTKLTLTQITYPAIYNADQDNYFDYELEITINVTKGFYSEITHQELTIVYSDTNTLNSVVLNEFYYWVDNTEKLLVNTSIYKAIYNDDPENFNDFELEITVNVTKATYKNITHKALVAVYTLTNTTTSLLLDEHFRWKAETKLTVSKTSYEAYYNADPDNYFDYELDVAVYVSKGTQATLVLNQISAKVYGDVSFNLVTSGGSGTGQVTFELVSGNCILEGNRVTILSSGNLVFKATKAGDDNFNSATSINMTVVISKRIITVTPTLNQGKYKGDADGEITYTISSGTLVNGDELTGSLSRDEGEEIGKYEILLGSLHASSNYNLIFTSKYYYEIYPKEITITEPSGIGYTFINLNEETQFFQNMDYKFNVILDEIYNLSNFYVTYTDSKGTYPIAYDNDLECFVIRYMQSNITIKVNNIAINSYKITYYTTPNASIIASMDGIKIISGVSVEIHKSVIFAINVERGYKFNGWYVNDELVESTQLWIAINDIKKDYKVEALIEEVPYEEVLEVYSVTGKVVNSSGSNISNALVIVAIGTDSYGVATTNQAGAFTINNIANGYYNVIVIYNGYAMINSFEVLDSDTSLSLTFVPSNTNYRVENTSTTAVVSDLDKINHEYLNEADSLVYNDGGSILITVFIDEIETEIELTQEQILGFVLDIKFNSVLYNNSGEVVSEYNLTVLNDLVKIVIPLPADAIGKTNYVIYRIHDGIVEAIKTFPNEAGEYFEVKNNLIYIYAKNFSQYSFVYEPIPPKKVQYGLWIGVGAGVGFLGACIYIFRDAYLKYSKKKEE